MQAEEILNCSYKDRKKSHHDAGMGFAKYTRGIKNLQKALSVSNDDNGKNSVYIHVPYCKKICSFCSMRRTINPVPDDYYKLIIKQIENYGKTEYVKTSEIGSIYFGGGTPTALPSEQLALVLQALYKNFNIKKNAEISMETTISELDEEKLKVLFDNGLNRLSIGVQTFNDTGRKILGRIGSGTVAEAMIQKAFRTGFKNVNIDIIYNYPDETEEILQSDLQRAFDLDIAGFSFYSLIVMDSSKLGHNLDKAAFTLSTLKRDASFFITILNAARKAGYDFLEITKLVKPERDNYEYIRTTHAGGNVFPIGAGAGGFVNGAAFMNPIEKDKFEKAAENFDKTMGMLLSRTYKTVKRFSGQLQEGIVDLSLLTEKKIKKISPLLERLKEEGLIQKLPDSDNFKFTDKGFFWGNTIAEEISKTAF